MMDDMEAHNKEDRRNREREEKETRADVVNVHEKQKKIKRKSKNAKLKNMDRNIEEKADVVKETRADVVNVHEKQKKLKAKRKTKKERLKNMDRNIEEKADCEVPKSKRKAVVDAESSKCVITKSKRVKFSDEVEVFPASCISNCSNEGGLVQGKRFSKEEDELIKKAVSDYIEANHLGEEGLDMILNCRSNPLVKGCWKEIQSVLHWRPLRSVYLRAHRLYEQGESNWTTEEVEFVKNSYKQYGPKWRMMADELGKDRRQVRTAFQQYKKSEDLNKGHWSQQEYQTLFELVNKDLEMGVFEEKKSKHGMLRDNIKWEAISERLGTRLTSVCCRKWYHQLTSPMVAEGNWADSDDYRLLTVLFDLDASSEDEVDWDSLLEHRSGEICRQRWLQMVLHLGEHGNKTFSEQVEVLSERYCPDLAEVRKAFDARPIMPIVD